MSKYWKFILAGIFILAGLIVYSQYNPAENSFFPKCPFFSLTGYQCLGCGSQRAFHQLLQGNFMKALEYNALFVFALPYIILGILFEFPLKNQYPKFQRFLFGYKAIYVVLTIIIGFWIFRFLLEG